MLHCFFLSKRHGYMRRTIWIQRTFRLKWIVLMTVTFDVANKAFICIYFLLDFYLCKRRLK